MDQSSSEAVEAIKRGDAERLAALIEADPLLATRPACGHPSLLHFLAVEGVALPNQAEWIAVLVQSGADIASALVAAASVDNGNAASALLDAGADPDGKGGWSPLEEALYWRNEAVTKLLLERGASIRNLRCAAALGRTDLVESCFNQDGSLKREAGSIDWPFGDPHTSQRPAPIKNDLMAKVDGWTRTSQAVLNNAFVFACMHNRLDVVEFLLDKGAEINAFPEGFDYDGTGLHYAAMNGHAELVNVLLARGADASLRDPKVGSTPAGWAEYGGQPDLAWWLSQSD